MGKTLRWVIPGSRLLLTDRAAILLSGSPPGRWAYDQPVSLRRTISMRLVSTFNRYVGAIRTRRNTPTLRYPTPTFRTRTPNAERQTPNAKRVAPGEDKVRQSPTGHSRAADLMAPDSKQKCVSISARPVTSAAALPPKPLSPSAD